MRVKRSNPCPNALSQTELFALVFIERYIAKRRGGRSPSIREIANHIGLCPSATYDLVNRLIEWGYLGRRDPDRRARNLVVIRSVIPEDRT